MDKEEHDLCPPPQTTVNIAGGDLQSVHRTEFKCV